MSSFVVSARKLNFQTKRICGKTFGGARVHEHWAELVGFYHCTISWLLTLYPEQTLMMVLSTRDWLSPESRLNYGQLQVNATQAIHALSKDAWAIWFTRRHASLASLMWPSWPQQRSSSFCGGHCNSLCTSSLDWCHRPG